MNVRPPIRPYSLRGLLGYFLRLGTLGFGGPIALAGYMQRDLVEDRGWISEQEFKEGLALAPLAPGPLAAQLAIYLGWVRGGILGATFTGILFVLPSFLMVLGLSALYVRFGGLSWMQGAFYGIGAAVIALIGRSAVKLARMTLGRDGLAWGICILSAVVTAATESEWVKAFVDGVTAAATGAIAGAAIVLGRRAIYDVPTVLIALGTLVVLLRTRRIPEPILILLAGAVGLLVRHPPRL
jgi:chromate transporter